MEEGKFNWLDLGIGRHEAPVAIALAYQVRGKSGLLMAYALVHPFLCSIEQLPQ